MTTTEPAPSIENILAMAAAREPREAARMAERVSAANGVSRNGQDPAWEQPVPLPGAGSPLPFPLDALPSTMRSFVGSVVEALAVPPDLAAIACLGAVSTVLTGAVKVQLRDGWQVPANLYLVAVADVGEAKSPTWQAAGEELFSIEAARREQAAPEIVKSQAIACIAADRAKELQRVASRARIEDAQTAKAAATEAATEAAEAEASVKLPPRLLAMDATPEALIKLAATNRGRLGVWSDEGGETFELASRYSAGGKANLGAYLKGHDGLAYASDRTGRDALALPALSFAMTLAIQPSVLRDLAADRKNRGRGLLARFLWSLAPTQVGSRPTDGAAIPQSDREAWCRLLRALAKTADGLEQPEVITLEPAAARRFAIWRATQPHPTTALWLTRRTAQYLRRCQR